MAIVKEYERSLRDQVLKICGCGLGSDGAIALLRVIDPEFKERLVVPLLDIPDEGGTFWTFSP